MFKYFLILSFLFQIGYSIAQTIPTTPPPPQHWADQNYVNQTKYWFYRNRLINEFMKVGPNAGESTPMYNLVRLKPEYEKYTLAYAGDGMVRSTGQYIGVLATEYYLLNRSGQDVSNTLKELYYAINAIKRLDVNAETYNFCNSPSLSPPLPPQNHCTGTGQSWNGFMIRDDIDCGPNSPITKYFRTKLSNPNLELETQLCFNLYKKKTTNGPKDVNDVTNNDVSHDQINNLMIGMRLVQNFVGPEATYNGVSLKDFAFVTIMPIMDHFGYGAPINGETCIGLERSIVTGKACDNSAFLNFICKAGTGAVCEIEALKYKGRYPWMIENTVTKQISCISIVGAGYGGLNSGGYAPTAKLLTGKKYPLSHEFSKLWTAYRDGSLTGAYHVGNKLHDNYKVLTQVALGDSWNLCALTKPCTEKVCIIPIANKCFFSIGLPIPGSDCGCVTGKLADTKRSLDKECVLAHYEILPLLHNVLFYKSGYYESALYGFHQDMINKAPCKGPYCYNSRHHAPDGWASLSILSEADQGNNTRWYSCKPKEEEKFLGEYNGLDYMLMYNLLHIYNNNYDYYPNYMDNLNIHDRTIHKGEYYNARSYVDDDGLTKHGNVVLDDIKVSTQSGKKMAVLDVRAGKSIKLKSGVSIKDGSYGHLYLYEPTDNWNWEMTVCNSFLSTTNQPNGHRQISEVDGIELEEELVEEINEEIEYNLNALGENIPNPATGITTIAYCTAVTGEVEFILTDVFGKEVLKLINDKEHLAGIDKVDIDVSSLKPGVYIYTLKAPGFQSSKKMIVTH